MATNILDYVRSRLRDSGVSLAAISEHTGIPLRTIYHIRNSQGEDHLYSRLRRLEMFFLSKEGKRK